MYSKPIEQLIRSFGHLPSVGRRTAERFVFYLLKTGKKDTAELTLALKNLITNIKSCEICWDFSDQSPCITCADKHRDSSLICVVAESQDAQAIERTGSYRGRYHILRGTLTTDLGIIEQPNIKIKELMQRIPGTEIKEIVLALNPDLAGETTMMYPEQNIKEKTPDITVSRLARGLPMGSDLQYADEITLSSALKYRIKS